MIGTTGVGMPRPAGRHHSRVPIGEAVSVGRASMTQHPTLGKQCRAALRGPAGDGSSSCLRTRLAATTVSAEPSNVNGVVFTLIG